METYLLIGVGVLVLCCIFVFEWSEEWLDNIGGTIFGMLMVVVTWPFAGPFILGFGLLDKTARKKEKELAVAEPVKEWEDWEDCGGYRRGRRQRKKYS